MERWIQRALTAVVLALIAVVSAGCDGGVSREEPEAAAAKPEAQPQSQQEFGEGGSALGKAKDTANNLVRQEEQRQKELTDLMNSGGGNDPE